MNLRSKDIKNVLTLWKQKNKSTYNYFQQEYVQKYKSRVIALEDYILYNSFPPVADYAPKTKDNYIGLELECFTELDKVELFEAIIQLDLYKETTIGWDGSISIDNSNQTGYEFKFLFKEKDLPSFMKKLGKFIRQTGIEVNHSCGLHVHLDMRNRDYKKCYAKLLKFQNHLFNLGNEDRLENEYCEVVTSSNSHDKYTAINKLPIEEINTLEVRLHEGTTDIFRIENYVRLLTRIVKQADPKKQSVLQNKQQLMSWVKTKSLKNYINKYHGGKNLLNLYDKQEIEDCLNNEHYDEESYY